MTIGYALTIIGLLLTVGIFLYTRKKDQEAKEKKNQADSEKRIAGVVDKYLDMESKSIVSGVTGLVRAGASLLTNEDELCKVTNIVISRGSKNPFGTDYEKLKEKNLLLMFIQEASRHTGKKGLMSKSSEKIIKILEEKSNR